MGVLFGDFYRSYMYDSPDGEDCLRKVFHTTKLFGFWGVYLSLYDIIGGTKPKGILHKLGRMYVWAAPFAACGATFATSVCLIGQIRQKDGAENHFLATAAAAVVFGAVSKNRVMAAGSFFPGAFAAVLTKNMKDAGLSPWGNRMPDVPVLNNRGLYCDSVITYNREEISPPPNY